MNFVGHSKKLRFHLVGIDLKQEHKPHFKEITLGMGQESYCNGPANSDKEDKTMIKKIDRKREDIVGISD